MDNSTNLTLIKASRALVYFIYFFVMLTLVILVFGFFLLLFGANPDASFTEWIYRSMNRVMAPFRGIFEPVPLNGDSVVDTSVCFAMIVYGILGIALHSLIDWLTYRMALTQQKMRALTGVGPQTVTAGQTQPAATQQAATQQQPPLG